jgi:hypothetical protein
MSRGAGISRCTSPLFFFLLSVVVLLPSSSLPFVVRMTTKTLALCPAVHPTLSAQRGCVFYGYGTREKMGVEKEKRRRKKDFYYSVQKKGSDVRRNKTNKLGDRLPCLCLALAKFEPQKGRDHRCNRALWGRQEPETPVKVSCAARCLSVAYSGGALSPQHSQFTTDISFSLCPSP